MQISPDAAKIKRWREERCWSQEHLAELAGIGLRTVQRLENGGKASRESVMALAAAFNVDAIALAADDGSEAAEQRVQKLRKDAAGLRLSFWIHLASYIFGAIVFTGISLGAEEEGYVMLWPLIGWTIGIAGHGLAVVIVELVVRSEAQNQA